MARYSRPDYFGNSDRDRRDAEWESSFSQLEDDFDFSDNRSGRRENGYQADTPRRQDAWGQSQPQSRPKPRTQSQPRGREAEPALSRTRGRQYSDSYYEPEDMPRKTRVNDYFYDSYDEEPYGDMPARDMDNSRDMAYETKSSSMSRRTKEPSPRRMEERGSAQPDAETLEQQYHLASVLEQVAGYLEELQKENAGVKKDNRKNQRMIEEVNQLIGDIVMNLQGMKQDFQSYIQNANNNESYQAIMAQTQVLDDKVENLTELVQEIAKSREDYPELSEQMEEQSRILEEITQQIQENQDIVLGLEDRVEDLREDVRKSQDGFLSNQDETDRKDFAITRTYFRTIMWLLLIVIVLLAAWLLGFIGPVNSVILLQDLTMMPIL